MLRVCCAVCAVLRCREVSECMVNECDLLGSPQCNPVFLYCPKGARTEFLAGSPQCPQLHSLGLQWPRLPLPLLPAGLRSDYGIFQTGIQLTLLPSFFQKYFSSLNWGFQVG